MDEYTAPRRSRPGVGVAVGWRRRAIVQSVARAWIVLLAGVLAATLAGCSVGRSLPDDRPTPSVTARAPVATATPPRPHLAGAGAVVIGQIAEPASLALPPTDGIAAHTIGSLLFSQLVAVDDRGEPRPDLAVEVPSLANGGARFIGEADGRQLQVTFRLRPTARWTDGVPVTARDVLFSWQLARNPRIGTSDAIEWRYERADAPDVHTVVLTFFSERSARRAAETHPNRFGPLVGQSGPVVDGLYRFGLPNIWIYPAHVLAPAIGGDAASSPRAREALETGPFARAPVGSGRYTLADWAAGDRLRFSARVDDDRPRPALSTILVRFESPPANAASLDRLRRGELDLIELDPGDGATRRAAAAVPGVVVDHVPSRAVESLDLNLDRPALRDRAVREAVAHALDRAELASAALGSDLAADAASPVLTGRSPPDRAAAERLLDGAGWVRSPGGGRAREGQPLALRLVTTDDAPRRRMAELVRDQLGAVGFAVEIQSQSARELFAPTTGTLSRRAFDLALDAHAGGLDPIADLRRAYQTREIPTAATSFAGDNVVGLRDAELDRLLDEAAAALDPARRRDLRAAIDRRIAEALVTVPLFTYPRIVARAVELRGARTPELPIGITWNAGEWTFGAGA